MGFWARLLGREVDTTVTDYQARVPLDGPFALTVEDVFTITGRGTVATGVVEKGSVRVGDVLEVLRPDGSLVRTTVAGLEAFRRRLEVAGPGERIGLLLDIRGDEIRSGSLLSRA